MKIGYIRVSTEEQNTARQEILLRDLGVDELFIDKASGKNANRPELARMMNYVRRGDTVIVESISRFARNTRDPARPRGTADRKAGRIRQPKGGNRHHRRQPANSCLPYSRLSQNWSVSISCNDSAKVLPSLGNRAKYTGRKPLPLPDNFERVVARWRAGEITATEAMRQTGLKPNTFYRRCAAKKALASSQIKPI